MLPDLGMTNLVPVLVPDELVCLSQHLVTNLIGDLRQSGKLRHLCELDDLAQDAFCAWLAQAQKGEWVFQSEARILHYLAKIVRNRLRQLRRDSQAPGLKRTRTEPISDDTLNSLMSQEPEPLKMLADREWLQRIQGQMSASAWNILLDYTQGMFWEDIGQKHGISAGAARKRLERAVVLVRRFS
jgi:DNA-directed RNA polymerase specialized sigma24 family protein